MSKEVEKLVETIIGFLVFIAVLIFLYLTVCRPAHADTNKNPRRGEWICWTTSIKDASCGTYGWHKQKKIAHKAALKLCENHCFTYCELDYCEKVK